MSDLRATTDAPTPPWVLLGTVVRCRRRALVLAFLATLAPLLYLTWTKGSPLYVSQAAIHVSARFPKMLSEDPEVQQAALDFSNFRQQQVYVITRFEVVQEALRRLGSRRSLWQLPDETDVQSVERLRSTLEVEAVVDSFLVTVALSGSEPAGLAEIVNAVVQSYLDVQREENLSEPRYRVGELEAYRAQIEAQIDEKVRQKSTLAQELGVSHFEASTGNPYEQSLADTRQRLDEARSELRLARLDLASLDSEQQLLLGLEIDSEARLLLGAPSGLQTDPLAQRLDELLAATAGLTPSHPGYEAALREIEQIRQVIDRRDREAASAIAGVLDQRRRTEAARARLAAEGLVQRAEQKVALLEQESARLAGQVADFITRFAKGRELEVAIERHRDKIAAIDERVSFLTIESEAPGFARLASPARTPELPEEDRRILFGLASLLVSAFVALGVAGAVHAVDARVQTPADVQRVAGFAPLGWIVEPTDATSQRTARHQLRRLALSLEREHRNGGSATFVVTTPERGRADRAFVQQLGEALAELDLRTLIIDADAAAGPGPADRPGLLDLLRGAAAPASTIVRGVPDHVPLGTGAEGDRLPDSHRVGAVLEQLAGSYEVVLLAAPPLASSADADLLVDHADATLLVVRARQDTLEQLGVALRTLERVAPSAVGLVVQGVDPRLSWSLTGTSGRTPPAPDAVNDPLVVDEATV